MRGTPAHVPARGWSSLALALVLTSCGGPTAEPAAAPEPRPEPATLEVEIYLANESLGDRCGEVFPVPRAVDADDPVTGALRALLAGPTEAEQADGYGGWFSAATADALLDVEVTDGTAHVVFTDLPELIPNASTSCGSAGLLAQLDQTLTALDGITATRYALADQAAFYEWSQLEDPDAPEAGEEEPPPEEPEDAVEPEVAAGLTVERIVAELEGELETDTLHPRDATVVCDASGPAQAGDVFVCSVSSVPQEPAGPWGRYVVAVLDDDTIARGIASDHPFTTTEVHELYAAAMHGRDCRDLRNGWPPTATGQLGADAAFLWSVVYWNLEGQPARMDADGDGIPCETHYEPDLVGSILHDISP
jgi:hypothetical protein